MSVPQRLSAEATLTPLGALSSEWLFDVLSRVVGAKIEGLSRIEQEYARAHPSAVLAIGLPTATDMGEARSLLDGAWGDYYLLLVHWLSAPVDAFCLGVWDRQDSDWSFEFYGGPHLWLMSYAETVEDFFSEALPRVHEDTRTMVYLDLFADFLAERDDSHALVKAWTLMEIMSESVPRDRLADVKRERKVARVRLLAEQLQMNPLANAPLLSQLYRAHSEDVVACTYRHRNCVAHEGGCRTDNRRCGPALMDSACRNAGELRKDVQLFLHGLIRNTLKPDLLLPFTPDDAD